MAILVLNDNTTQQGYNMKDSALFVATNRNRKAKQAFDNADQVFGYVYAFYNISFDTNEHITRLVDLLNNSYVWVGDYRINVYYN